MSSAGRVFWLEHLADQAIPHLAARLAEISIAINSREHRIGSISKGCYPRRRVSWVSRRTASDKGRHVLKRPRCRPRQLVARRTSTTRIHRRRTHHLIHHLHQHQTPDRRTCRRPTTCTRLIVRVHISLGGSSISISSRMDPSNLHPQCRHDIIDRRCRIRCDRHDGFLPL